MSKQFTLGEIATVITGVCHSKVDPCAKQLIAHISGEPASEFTWMLQSPNRVDYSREWLEQTLDPELVERIVSGAIPSEEYETTLVEVLAHSNFPKR